MLMLGTHVFRWKLLKLFKSFNYCLIKLIRVNDNFKQLKFYMKFMRGSN